MYIFHLHCLRVLSLLQITFDASMHKVSIQYIYELAMWRLGHCLKMSSTKHSPNSYLLSGFLQEEIPQMCKTPATTWTSSKTWRRKKTQLGKVSSLLYEISTAEKS